MKKMKKLFTLALALLCGMGAMADDYTGHLVLVRGGETIQDQEKVATLTRLDNGQYTLSVDNLTYEAAGMGIGNVVIDSIDAVGNPDQPGVTDLGVAKSIRISSGTISGFPVWVGPRLGAVPIELEGKVAAGQLYFKVKAEASFYGTDLRAILSLAMWMTSFPLVPLALRKPARPPRCAPLPLTISAVARSVRRARDRSMSSA